MVDARSRGELGTTETVAMTALEDRFGLNPKARRALQWEIAQAEKTRPKDERVPHLKVVKDG
jgi:phage terminase small subunit